MTKCTSYRSSSLCVLLLSISILIAPTGWAVNLRDASQFLVFQYSPEPQGNSELGRAVFVGDIGMASTTKRLVFSNVVLTGDVYRVNSGIQVGTPTDGEIIEDPELIAQTSDQLTDAWVTLWNLDSDSYQGDVDISGDLILDYAGTPDNEIVLDYDFFRHTDGRLIIRGDADDNFVFRIKDGLELGRSDVTLEGIDASRVIITVGDPENTEHGSIEVKMDSGIWLGTLYAPYAISELVNLDGFQGLVISGEIRLKAADDSILFEKVTPPILKLNQTITTFTPQTGTTFVTTDSTNILAEASSELPTTLTIIQGPGQITGNLLSFTGSGIVQVEAYQAGDGDWNPTPPVTNTFNVVKAEQTITYFTPADGTTFAATDTTNLTAAATSGLPVRFSVISGPGIIGGGNTLSFSGPGAVEVAAIQAGDTIWNAADPIIHTYTAIQSGQTINNFVPADGSVFSVSDTTNLSATASSGLPVSFSVVGGPGIISGGNALSFSGPGTVTVAATQGGNSEWSPAVPVTNSYTVGRADQTIINFVPPDGTLFNTRDIAELTATATSGLNVSFLVANGPGLISGENTLTFSGPGSVEVIALQAGNPNWNPAPLITNTYIVTQSPQTIAEFTPPDGSQFIIADTPLLSASASSGLPVAFNVISGPGSLSGNTLSFSSTGIVTVAATQSGNSDWEPAVPVTNSYTITGGSQTITDFSPQTGTAFVLTDSTNLSATATSGLPVSFNVISGPGSIVSGNTLAFQATGTVIVQASQPGSEQWNPAVPVTNSYTVGQADQTITSFTPADGTEFLTRDTTNLVATATSGLPVSFSILDGPGSINGESTLTFTGAGAVQVQAAQTGNSDWNAAPPVVHTYTVNKSDQFISNFTPTNGTEFLVTDTDTMEATASSGLTVGFRILSGPAFIVGRNDLHFSGSGTVLVETYQSGNNDWKAATPLTNTYTAIKVPQSILTFTPPDGTGFVFTDVTNLTATTSSDLPVLFTVINGPGWLDGNMLSFSGTGNVSVEASQSGTAVFDIAPPLTNTYTVGKADQAISDFLPADGTIFQEIETTNLSAISSSGLPVSFTVTSGPGAIDPGNNLSFTGTGTVVVEATQSGNDDWNAALPITHTYTVIKSDQVITDFVPETLSSFETSDAPVLSATASSGLPVSFDVVSGPGTIDPGNTLRFSGSGTVLVEATQSGDADWNAAIPVTNSYSVGKSTAIITISNTNQTYTGNSLPVDTASVPSGLDVTVAYEIEGVWTETAPTDAGAYAVIAGILNNPTNQGSAEATLTIAKADQTITDFSPVDESSFLTTDTASLSATAFSGLDVNFRIISGPGMISTDNTLSFTGAGTVQVSAFQDGNNNWNAAPAVTNSYNITKADQTISNFTPADESTFPVGSRTNLFATSGSGLPVTFKVLSGSAVLIGENLLVFEGVGTVLVEATQPGDADWNSAQPVTNAYTITKVDQNITDFTPPTGTLFRTTDSAVLSATASSRLDVTFTVVSGPGTISGGNSLSFSSTGLVEVVASQSGNPFYNPAPTLTNTYTITQNQQTISNFTPADGTLFQVINATNLSAVATSGLNVSFNVISGPAVITDGNRLSFSSIGTVLVEASQGGNNDWSPALPITNTYTVGKADQTITSFTPADATAFLTTDITNLTAETTSGLPLNFSVVSGPGLITGGNQLSFSTAGTVQIAASQAGNDIWNAAQPITNSYAVNKADQVISEFTPIDGSALLTTNITRLAATASSGLDVSFTVTDGNGLILFGDTLLVLGDGTVEVEAVQNGNEIWNAALPLTNTYEVSKVDQVITDFTPPDNTAFLISETATLNASATSGRTVIFRIASGPGRITGYNQLSFSDEGIVAVEAIQTGNITWNTAPTNTHIYTVTKADQAISGFTPATGTTFLTTETTNLSATASSGLNVVFSVIDGPGNITGGRTLSFSASGTVSVVASQSGNNEWNPAQPVTNRYSISKADQTISGFTPENGTTFLTTDTTNLMATATSGLPILFTVIDGPAVISGGNTLTISGEGVVRVEASQSGDEIWNAATSVTNNYTVTKQDQTISGFAPSSGATFKTVDLTNLVATASSELNVQFTVVSGPGVITGGDRLSFSGAGTVLVEASQSGNEDWYSAPPLTNIYTVSKTSATVALLGLNQTYDGGPHPVLAITAPFGLSVNILYDGISAAPKNTGSYEVIGSIDDAFYAGTVTNTLSIIKGSQTIINFIPPTLSAFETTDMPELSAEATSGLPVSIALVDGPAILEEDTLRFTNSGTVRVEAIQEGNTNWNEAVALTNSYSVGKALATITISNTNQTYTGSPLLVDTTTSPTGLPVTVVYNNQGQRISSLPTDAGSYNVEAGVIDHPIYQAYAKSVLTIEPADQIISDFTPTNGATFLTTNVVTLSANAESGLDVEFSVLSGPGTIVGNILTFSDSVLPVEVEASQSGDNNWNAAPSLTNTYTVLNSLPTFTSEPVTNATQDVLYTYLITTDDIDGDTVFISAPILPDWLTLSRLALGTSLLSGTPGNAQVGTHDIMLVANDGDGGSVTQRFDLVVSNINDNPTFTSTPKTIAAVGIPYSYTATAVDIDGDPVAITAPTLAAWMTFDSGSNTLYGIPPAVETNAVLLIADDGFGGTATQSFNVVVNDWLPAPTPMSAINITNTEFIARWRPTANALGYNLDVSTSTNFTVPVPGYDDLDVGNVSSCLVTGLTENTVYYYQIRAQYPPAVSANSIPSDPVLTSDESPFPQVDYTNAVVSVGAFDYLYFDELFDGTDLVVELITNTQPGRVEVTLDPDGVLLNYLDVGKADVQLRATAPNGAWVRFPIDLTIVTAPFMDASEPIEYNRQNGLFEQNIYVFNTSGLNADTVTLTVSDLPPDASLHNATGTNIYGEAENKWVGTLPGYRIRVFTLQYYTPFRQNTPSGIIEASLNLIPPYQILDRLQNPDVIVYPSSGPNVLGEMVIEFSTVPGERYSIQYTDNLMGEWQLAYPEIRAITTRTQWIDHGPPFTATTPRSARFYRVVQFKDQGGL